MGEREEEKERDEGRERQMKVVEKRRSKEWNRDIVVRHRGRQMNRVDREAE